MPQQTKNSLFGNQFGTNYLTVLTLDWGENSNRGNSRKFYPEDSARNRLIGSTVQAILTTQLEKPKPRYSRTNSPIILSPPRILGATSNQSFSKRA